MKGQINLKMILTYFPSVRVYVCVGENDTKKTGINSGEGRNPRVASCGLKTFAVR